MFVSVVHLYIYGIAFIFYYISHETRFGKVFPLLFFFLIFFLLTFPWGGCHALYFSRKPLNNTVLKIIVRQKFCSLPFLRLVSRPSQAVHERNSTLLLLDDYELLDLLKYKQVRT